jgi:hypothetical protein
VVTWSPIPRGEFWSLATRVFSTIEFELSSALGYVVPALRRQKNADAHFLWWAVSIIDAGCNSVMPH